MTMLGSPLVREIPYRDPYQVTAHLAGLGFDRRGLVLLDSARPDPRLGRHAFVACDPFQVLAATGRAVAVGERRFAANPWDVLAAEVGRFRLDPHPGLPPFQGGAAGLFGYDLGRHLERLTEPGPDPLGFPEMLVGFFDTVVGFDRHRRLSWISSTGDPERGGRAREARMSGRADALEAALEETPAAARPTFVPVPAEAWNPDCERGTYEDKVARVIEYIRAGDVYQANLSRRYAATTAADFDPLALYGALRTLNPAPFAAYLSVGGNVLLSASPERFLKLDQNRVETRPIKGTRPRCDDPDADARLARELLDSEKDRAENLMIVDLLRNDISRVCLAGTVKVPELFVLESYATVHHLVSTVVGRIEPGAGPVDLLKACFPGGSITGAPKIRAMEIIAELEPQRRGPFFGSVGYIGFDGAMDTNLTIRTLVWRENLLALQVGGGIVADSNPAAEYEETLTKAKALFAAAAGTGTAEAPLN